MRRRCRSVMYACRHYIHAFKIAKLTNPLVFPEFQISGYHIKHVDFKTLSSFGYIHALVNTSMFIIAIKMNCILSCRHNLRKDALQRSLTILKYILILVLLTTRYQVCGRTEEENYLFCENYFENV